MGYIEWSSSLSLGFEEIDRQHRGLIDRINALAAAMEEKREKAVLQGILEDLGEYAATHFSLEEGYFDRFGYREAAAHRKEHADFAARVLAFKDDFAADKSKLSEELLVFLRSWLTKHIAFSDRKYRSTFAQNGLT